MSSWVTPEFVEIKMDAEIGSYQADEGSPADEPLHDLGEREESRSDDSL